PPAKGFGLFSSGIDTERAAPSRYCARTGFPCPCVWSSFSHGSPIPRAVFRRRQRLQPFVLIDRSQSDVARIPSLSGLARRWFAPNSASLPPVSPRQASQMRAFWSILPFMEGLRPFRDSTNQSNTEKYHTKQRRFLCFVCQM